MPRRHRSRRRAPNKYCVWHCSAPLAQDLQHTPQGTQRLRIWGHQSASRPLHHLQRPLKHMIPPHMMNFVHVPVHSRTIVETPRELTRRKATRHPHVVSKATGLTTHTCLNPRLKRPLSELVGNGLTTRPNLVPCPPQLTATSPHNLAQRTSTSSRSFRAQLTPRHEA
jgi:hypothetical protein